MILPMINDTTDDQWCIATDDHNDATEYRWLVMLAMRTMMLPIMNDATDDHSDIPDDQWY